MENPNRNESCSNQNVDRPLTRRAAPSFFARPRRARHARPRARKHPHPNNKTGPICTVVYAQAGRRGGVLRALARRGAPSEERSRGRDRPRACSDGLDDGGLVAWSPLAVRRVLAGDEGRRLLGCRPRGSVGAARRLANRVGSVRAPAKHAHALGAEVPLLRRVARGTLWAPPPRRRARAAAARGAVDGPHDGDGQRHAGRGIGGLQDCFWVASEAGTDEAGGSTTGAAGERRRGAHRRARFSDRRLKALRRIGVMT